MRTISFQRKISKARLVFSVCNDFGEQICGFGRCTCGILLQKLTLKWSTPSLAPEPEILTLRQRSWILKILSVIPIISLFVRVPYYFYRNSNYSGHMKYNCGIRAYILRTGLDEYALRLHKNNRDFTILNFFTHEYSILIFLKPRIALLLNLCNLNFIFAN